MTSVVVLTLILPKVLNVCPKHDLIKPCFCIDDHFRCGGNTTIDLIKIFESLENNLSESEKHLKSFTLKNTAINELRENTFKDILFDQISLESCKNLTSIHENAFNGTDSVTKMISIEYCPLLTFPKGSVFDILCKFLKIESILLLNNKMIIEIPSNAFHSSRGDLDHLTEIQIYGPLTKIGSNAFSTLKNVRYIGFEHAAFNIIPDYAFAFDQSSNDTLIIDLTINPMINSSVFSEKSLLNMKRVTKLKFGNACCPKQMVFLNEKPFLPFLLQNQKNTIDLDYEEFDCNDCRNYWIRRNTNITSRVINLKCSNGKTLLDQNNFKMCNK